MIELRPLLPGDVEAADEVAFSSLRECARVYEHLEIPERTAEGVQRGRARIAHLQRTDPAGAWLATDGDVPVGLALALRRGPMWFLSLLAVGTSRQGQGIGAQLLDASLGTASDAKATWLLATLDPKALRRYALAGFRLHAGLAAKGVVDRILLPTGLAVRDGDPDTDRELVEDVVTGLRGAAYGPDIDAFLAYGCSLLVAEDGRDRGFCWANERGVFALGATSEQVAQRLLWETLARTSAEVTVQWLTADQQWALDVVLAARLALQPGGVSCRRSSIGPMTPYLPGGAYG